MAIISESAEHHFLTMLESLKADPKGWVVLSFSLSKNLTHEKIIEHLSRSREKISGFQARSSEFAGRLAEKLSGVKKSYVYRFIDGDVIALALPGNAKEKELLESAYKEMAAGLKAGQAESASLFTEMYNFQKLADQKILSAKRFSSYDGMADTNKVASISVRRERRENSKVLLIEDDRFTATYTAGILAKEYDLITCVNGEEGIAAYIEHAPDIALVDVHLPGLSGHQTLEALKAIDPAAFVVMLSVDTVKDSIVKASEGGAKNFLKKPFSKERLLNVVKNSPHIRGFEMGKSSNL